MKKFLIAFGIFATFSVIANDALINRFTALGMSGVEIKSSPLSGIKTVITDQGVFYSSEDGQYVLQGKLFKLTDKSAVDLTGKVLTDKLNVLQKEMLVYPAKNEKYVVTVFMDISCHYCHLLHQQVSEYNKLGITVRYLAFPRAGLSSKTASQMEAIWTAEDPIFALNEAEKGNFPKMLKTPLIVKRHYNLGTQFGVQGTPAIVTAEGNVIGGYLKPADLLRALEIKDF
ncbi:bifunctional protein-disulfide isomerase/oxidoreductase DsbC [Seminibacterium arietis]|uniref:Thiol:disulfide interchange protein n=1 Tax=Seminibacterium arietis TaxID=1173502 RepID=A0ABW3I8A8_9PAST